MDINDMRSILTVAGLVCFLGICFWAYSKSAKDGFDEAAQLPFTDDDLPARKDPGQQRKEG
ncbi:MAG: cbb3-type cytochrome c oxidase subunit 3 [Denitromonas halophila]|nr:MAG: cbb3-type cytochrome c oxidase subunit 3 [Denitromonas halophila]TVT66218.1 MAG: cbb3-type cytochrome c oxidase subunit 3 [Denitromonas halophila]TVT75564.1 MAG: cbb3-type cytochrome c oxidase subunit 3 [Denitromonas halophila]